MSLRTSRHHATLDSYKTARQRERAFFAAQRANRQRLHAALVVAMLLVTAALAIAQGRAG